MTLCLPSFVGAPSFAIGAQFREIVAPRTETVGVQVHGSPITSPPLFSSASSAVEVRDVMLPCELRKAFSEVLEARQEGQAALERARGGRRSWQRYRANAERSPHSRRSGNPLRCATSPTPRASSKASRRSRHSASCKRSKRPVRVGRS